MRSRTVLVSAAIHAGLALVALGVATTGRQRAATPISIVESKRRAPEGPPKPAATPEPARTAPPRRVAAATRRSSAARAPAEAVTDTDPASAQPDGEGDGPGIALPAEGAPAPAEPAPPPPAPAITAPKPRPAPRPRPDEGCREPATKPVPERRGAPIEYTTRARADGAEGRLVLTLTIAEDGSVSAVKVRRGVHPSLDAAAASAVRSWRFRPAMRCGKPVEGTYTMARRFELGD